MKRWRDGGGFDDLADRDRAPEGPLAVQPVASSWRGRRWVIPLVVGAVVLTFLLAVAGRYAAYFSGPSHTPAPPTAVAWIAATVPPTPTPAPTASPDPDATPASETPSPAATLAPLVRVELSALNFSYVPGQTVEFTVTLTNPSAMPLSLSPCPSYVVYLPGTNTGPERLLNCAASGSILGPGESLAFQMLFVIPDAASSGQQTLIWQLRSGLNGNGSTDIVIWPAGPTPNL